MSHTNTTANYNLPQFIGTDKPSWLTDVNGAMTSIDTQMKANADASTTADGKATTANTSIGTLSSLTTSVKNDLVSAINEVDANADTAQTSANNAGTIALNAKNKADGIESFLDINTFKNLTVSVNRGTVSENTFKSAHNSDGSLGKVYGYVTIQNTAGTTPVVVTLSDTGLRPSEAITINSSVLRSVYVEAGFNDFNLVDMTINPNGTVVITSGSSNVVTWMRLSIVPFLIFAKNFGD